MKKIYLTLSHTTLDPAIFSYVQGNNGVDIVFTLSDYEHQEDAKARFFARRPSRSLAYEDCELFGNRATLSPSREMFLEVGTYHCTLEILYANGNKVFDSYPIEVHVTPNEGFDPAIKASNEYLALTNIVGKTDKAITDMNNKLVEADTRLAAMEKDADDRLSTVESNADSRLTAVEKDADDRLSTVESNAETTLSDVKSDADSRLTAVENDANTRLEKVESDASYVLSQVKVYNWVFWEDDDGHLCAMQLSDLEEAKKYSDWDFQTDEDGHLIASELPKAANS